MTRLWAVTREYVDHQVGMHVTHLQNARSKATHLLQIVIGKDSCPLCGHVIPKTNTGELDPRAHLVAELDALELVHTNIEQYARKHNIPVRQRR